MKLFSAFATVGGLTMVSRVLGFARDVMIALALGTGPVADAFFVAFRFPNLFRRLFAEGAFNAAFVEAGLGWFWDQPRYGELLKVTGGKERIAHFIDTVLRRPRTADTDSMIALLHRRKTALYGQMVGSGQVELRPGIAELIAAARGAGVRMAIATTTSRPNVDALLAATLGAAASPFEVIVAGDEVAKKKPAPDVYVEALRLLGLGAAACLALEDSANGVRSSCAAGIPVLVTKGVYTSADNFDGAIAVVDDLAALAANSRDAEFGASVLAAMRARHASHSEIFAVSRH